MPNPNRVGLRVGLGMLAVGVAAAAWPFVSGMDGMNGGFALTVLGGFVALSGTVTAVMFGRRAAELDRIFAGESLLAHWTVPPEIWWRVTSQDAADLRSGRIVLFYVLLFWAVVIGGGFVFMDPDHGAPVMIILAGIVALCGALAFRPTQGQASSGQVFIARKAVALNSELYTWSSPLMSLDRIDLESGEIPVMAFTCSAVTGTGPQEVAFRVPIPPGWEAYAAQLAAHLWETRND